MKDRVSGGMIKYLVIHNSSHLNMLCGCDFALCAEAIVPQKNLQAPCLLIEILSA